MTATMSTTILDPLALWGIQGMTHHQAQALIAAAPLLLEVLKDLVLLSDQRVSHQLKTDPSYFRSQGAQHMYERAVCAIDLAEGMGGL